MYKSPIELIYEDIQSQIEEGIYKAVQKVDIKVDRDELLKALEYDRGQYNKGYEDAKAERKKGKWRVYEGEMTCSCCETTFYTDMCEYIDGNVPKFCPWCGADMRGEQDAETN